MWAEASTHYLAAMQCSNCGAEGQTGKFCSECGQAMEPSCPHCEADVEPGGRYCPSCGEGIAHSGGMDWFKWVGASLAVVAAIVVLAVALVLFLPGDTENAGPPAATGAATAPVGGAGMGGGVGGGMGGLSPDMRINADRLFNRIMLAAEQGDQAEVQRFMPMAVQAYGMVEDLNADGQYHLAILHATAGNPDQARVTAERILTEHPNHLLALGVAAGAAREAGDEAAAEQHYRQLLEAYPEQSGRALPEYVDHQQMVEEYHRLAQEYVAGG